MKGYQMNRPQYKVRQASIGAGLVRKQVVGLPAVARRDKVNPI